MGKAGRDRRWRMTDHDAQMDAMVGPSELEVVRSMVYCLCELKAGRWPK